MFQRPSQHPFVAALQELLQLFTPFGPVHECRVLHTGDGLKGAGALVRMATVEAATAAINGINGRTPQGSSLPLLVRFADSPEEKARKQQVLCRLSFVLGAAALIALSMMFWKQANNDSFA